MTLFRDRNALALRTFSRRDVLLALGGACASATGIWPTREQIAVAQPPSAASDFTAGMTSVRTLDGPAFRGRLILVTEPGEFTFETSEKERKTLPPGELVRFGFPADVALKGTQALLLLRDGGRLVGRLESLDREAIVLDSYFFGPVEVPRADAAGVVFQGSSDPALLADFVQELLAGDAAADRLLLDNGDRLEGAINSASYPMDGDLSAQRPTLDVVVAGATVALPGDGLRAVRFADGKKSAIAPPRLWVGLRDGSLVAASELLLKGLALSVRRRADQAPWQSQRRDALAFVQPIGGKIVYLSDLEPQRYRHVPFLTLERPYFADRNALGLPLRAAGRTHLKGLGMFPAAALTYSLTGGYRKFEAELAVDDAAGRAGSVTFQVLLDGKPQGESPTLHGGDAAQSFSLDVAGAKTLTLVVYFADHGDALDYADWLDARVVK
ncbi:MAG TPA: NPCBM/NEW2 domain-containing protein [Pirellulales bacterium]